MAYLAAKWNFSGYETRAATDIADVTSIFTGPFGTARVVCANDRLTAKTCEK